MNIHKDTCADENDHPSITYIKLRKRVRVSSGRENQEKTITSKAQIMITASEIQNEI